MSSKRQYISCFFFIISCPALFPADPSIDIEKLFPANSSLVQNDGCCEQRTVKAWIEPQTMAGSVNKSASFRCFIIAQEPVFFEWHFENSSINRSDTEGLYLVKDADPVRQSSSPDVLFQSGLFIRKTTPDSTGNYVCKIFGVGYRTITLSAKLLLPSVENVRKSTILNLMAILSILVPFCVGTIIITTLEVRSSKKASRVMAYWCPQLTLFDFIFIFSACIPRPQYKVANSWQTMFGEAQPNRLDPFVSWSFGRVYVVQDGWETNNWEWNFTFQSARNFDTRQRLPHKMQSSSWCALPRWCNLVVKSRPIVMLLFGPIIHVFITLNCFSAE